MATAGTVHSPDLFNGKRVLISGGGSTIGDAMIWLLARLGAEVILVGRATKTLQTIENALVAHGYRAQSYVLDIGDAQAVEFLFNELWWKGDHIDVLVNSMVGQTPASLNVSDCKTFRETCLEGGQLMMQAAAKQWLQEGLAGNIVNVVPATEGGLQSIATYIEDTNEMAMAWTRQRIRCNCLAVGLTDADGNYTVDSNTMHPLLSAWNIAEVAAFLGSNASKHMTGEMILLDGRRSLPKALRGLTQHKSSV